MENTPPESDIRKLRRRARGLGIAIRTKRASRSQPEPAYDLVDLTSGKILAAGLNRSDLQANLGRIADEAKTPPQRTDASRAEGAADRPRFCESCGDDQEAVGGRLTRTPEGAWVCEDCARSTAGTAAATAAIPPAVAEPVRPAPAAVPRPADVASKPATVESTPVPTQAPAARRRALSGQPPLRDRRGVVKKSGDARRWIPVSAAMLGIVTLIVATQQPAFRQANGGGVLGATAAATTASGGSISSGQAPETSGSGADATSPSGSSARGPSGSTAPAANGSTAPVANASPAPAGSTTPAAAAADLRVGPGTVRTWTGPYRETRMQVIVPVANEGKDPVALPRSASTYRVVDGRGRELASGLFTIALPGTIAPKETAYLVETVSAVFVAGSGTPKVTAHVAAIPVAAPTASLRVTDVAATTGPDGGMRVTGVVHNDGAAKTGWLVAGGVLVDPKGRAMGAAYDPGRVGPLDPGATAKFDTSYPGAPPPTNGTKLVGVAFEALDQGGS